MITSSHTAPCPVILPFGFESGEREQSQKLGKRGAGLAGEIPPVAIFHLDAPVTEVSHKAGGGNFAHP
jgi:hypothetical protein